MKRLTRKFVAGALLAGGIAVIAGHSLYAQDKKPAEAPKAGGPPAAVSKAVAVVYPASNSNVHGTVTFEKVSGGIKVVADLQGLTPGKHGFHVHEFGDCSTPDAASAGGHFNPTHQSHGAPTDKMRHEGGVGNITADSSGTAHLEWTDPVMSFMGPQSVIGHSVVVHANEDDLKSQPAGNAGPRIGCGVIGVAKPKAP